MPIGHWHNLAVTLAELFDELATGKKNLVNLPGGVLREANAFLDPVTHVVWLHTIGELPINPEVARANHRFARAAYGGVSFKVLPVPSSGMADLGLLAIARFTAMLVGKTELNDLERKVAADVASFFRELARMGE